MSRPSSSCGTIRRSSPPSPRSRFTARTRSATTLTSPVRSRSNSATSGTFKAMRTRTFFRYVLLALALAAVACTVHQQGTPSLTGPSEFALSVSVTALPDTINQDGGSQSSIRVTAHGPQGQPLAGQTLRIDILVNGSQVDFGTLSARTIVTGSDRTGVAGYTAPSA